MATATGAKGDDKWADMFLSAALEPGKWGDAIREMAVATGSRHGQLIGFGAGASGFNWISDIDTSIVPRGAVIDQAQPDQNFRVAADQLPDRPDIVHEAHYDMARPSLRSDDYLDLCSDFDIFDGCQTRLIGARDQMVGLALLRNRKDGRTTQDQRDMFAHIAGHARSAVLLQQAIEQQGFALLSGTFEAMDRACWLLDATGRVGGMTPRADALLSSSRLRVSDGWLASDRPDETRAIGRSMRAIIDPPARTGDPVALADAGISPLACAPLGFALRTARHRHRSCRRTHRTACPIVDAHLPPDPGGSGYRHPAGGGAVAARYRIDAQRVGRNAQGPVAQHL
jgi:hypothetical protein